MFTKLLETDEWAVRRSVDRAVTNPTWSQVTEAITDLDGKSRTIVILSERPESDHYMIVAGSWEDLYMVNATKDNSDFWSLVDPDGSTNKRMVFVGGQDGEYEERMFVPLPQALEAARTFYETGEFDPSLNWESDY